MIVDEDVYLEHFGVKGMRWGVRKRRDEGARKGFFQKRKEKKEARIAEGQKKAAKFLDDALKKPNDLILLNGRVVVTGQEFVNHMANGGLLDIRTTRIYATQKTPTSAYELAPRR